MDTKCLATDGGCVKSCGGRKPLAIKMQQVLDITVLMGGPSTEREVSLVSGGAISDALQRAGHKITRCDISPTDTSALDRKGIDVVFIALHGLFGESGEVQELCEKRGLRYTGSTSLASTIAIDKAASKEAFRNAGILTANWTMIYKGQSQADILAAVEPLGLPAVVKPVDGGSSVDVTIARDAAARDAAIADCVAKYEKVMVEAFVKGREFTVGILGKQALPVIEIKPGSEFYDYTAKYADNSGTQYLFDHGLPEQTVANMQSAALLAYESLGCRDMSRVDFIVDAAGDAYVLEINTIPGFTSHSLLPMAAAKAGIKFDELVCKIVDMAMQR
ncbi:MAG: D-alanine--D-alanine ligase [Planctomycetaceae bacterium]|nr:MAG: D-alanine--D-alanine ligase [Planctomycetaceae bacterium]